MPCSSIPPLSPEVCSNTCPLSQWCYLTILYSDAPFFFLSSIFLSIRVFSNELGLHIWESKYWIQLQHQSFQWIFRIDFLEDWLVWSFCWPWDSQESFPAQFESTNFSGLKASTLRKLSLLYGLILTSVHDYWKNHSFDYVDLCQQSDVSAF